MDVYVLNHTIYFLFLGCYFFDCETKNSICFLSFSQETTPNQRVSFYAKILHASTETNTELPGHPASESTATHNAGWHVIVSDASLQGSKGCHRDEKGVGMQRGGDGGSSAEYLYLHVRSGCVVPGVGMAVIGGFGSMVFCKDVCIQQGEYVIYIQANKKVF